MKVPLAPLALGLVLAVPAAAAPRTYVVDAAASSLRIHVGKAGAFGFAGHVHEVAAPAMAGEVTADPADLSASRLSLSFEAGALKVLPEGEPAGDAPKVEEIMRGPRVLDVARFPAVDFKSEQVSGRAGSGGAYDVEVKGQMSLHGVSRALTLPIHVELAGDTLTASGTAVLRHDQFGMQPVSAAGGSVKVKNEIAVEYRIVARGR